MKRGEKGERSRGRRGFTLTEMMIASALTTVVMSQVGMALISAQRMFEATFADVELSLQSRALREKLLFGINDDGGLMNARQTDLSLVNGVDSQGTGISFVPIKGLKNKVVLNDEKRLVADLGRTERWLECGTMVFQGTNVFGLFMTNGTIEVNLDVAIAIANRRYVQRNRVQAQIMNE